MQYVEGRRRDPINLIGQWVLGISRGFVLRVPLNFYEYMLDLGIAFCYKYMNFYKTLELSVLRIKTYNKIIFQKI